MSTAPDLTNLTSSVNFDENSVNSTPAILDADVTLDAPTSDWEFGEIIVSGLLSEDTVSVRNVGSAPGQIGFDSDTGEIFYGGEHIADLYGGDGQTMTIGFNWRAITASVEAVIEHLTYANTSDTPTASHDLYLTIKDRAALSPTGSPFTINVGIQAENDLAELGGAPADQSVAMGTSTTLDLSAYDLKDADGDQITLTLSVDRGTLAAAISADIVVDQSDNTNITLTGTAGELTAYLQAEPHRISFTPATGDTTAAILTITPNDGTADGSDDRILLSVATTNYAPSGTVTITGNLVDGSELTAKTNTITDANGLGALTYQWFRDDSAITGAVGATYTLTQNDVGAEISVQVRYTDDDGFNETLTSLRSTTVQSADTPDDTPEDTPEDTPDDTPSEGSDGDADAGSENQTKEDEVVNSGTVAELVGIEIDDFGNKNKITFTDATFKSTQVSFDAATSRLNIDTDGDGEVDGHMTLNGDFDGGTFMTVARDGKTYISYETFLPDLQDGKKIDPDLVNGLNNTEFLTGDGEIDFRVEMDSRSGSGFDNTLGVYEIDENGNIINARILFEQTTGAQDGAVTLGNIENGHKLGFFMVQDGADWAASLTQEDELTFVTSGDKTTPDVLLNGDMQDLTVFHAIDPDMNIDGLQHALSGASEDGQSIYLGFEDQVNGGDRDYQDVLFHVSTGDFI